MHKFININTFYENSTLEFEVFQNSEICNEIYGKRATLVHLLKTRQINVNKVINFEFSAVYRSDAKKVDIPNAIG